MYDGSECSLLSTRLTDYPSLFPLHPASTAFYDLEIQDSLHSLSYQIPGIMLIGTFIGACVAAYGKFVFSDIA